MNARTRRVWHIEHRHGRFYVVDQFGGFARWHADAAGARAQLDAYVRDYGDEEA